MEIYTITVIDKYEDNLPTVPLYGAFKTAKDVFDEVAKQIEGAGDKILDMTLEDRDKLEEYLAQDTQFYFETEDNYRYMIAKTTLKL